MKLLTTNCVLDVLVGTIVWQSDGHGSAYDWDFTKNGTKECYAEMLKNKSLIEKSFRSDDFRGSLEECQRMTDNALDRFEDDLSTYMNTLVTADENFTNHKFDFRDCVKDLTSKYDMTSLYLKGLTFNLFKAVDIEHFRQEFIHDLRFYVHVAKNICDQKTITEKFNFLATESANSECKRKYLIENGFINESLWQIAPQNLTPLGCSEVINQLEESVDMLNIKEDFKYFGIPLPDASHCIYWKLRDAHINQKREAVAVLKTFNLNQQLSQKLLESFNEIEERAADKIIECIALSLITSNF